MAKIRCSVTAYHRSKAGKLNVPAVAAKNGIFGINAQGVAHRVSPLAKFVAGQLQTTQSPAMRNNAVVGLFGFSPQSTVHRR